MPHDTMPHDTMPHDTMPHDTMPHDTMPHDTMPLAVLSALAEPTRLRAMALLSDGGEHCVCDLMARLDATQSRMSRHMQVLKQAGLVVDRRDAQWVRYRLNPDLAPDLRAIVKAVLAATAPHTPNRKVA